MRKLLWWCIWLWVVGSQHTVDGRNSEPTLKFRAEVHQISTRLKQNPSDKNYRLPSTVYRLPCEDSSPTCLQTLGDLAVQNSREIAVLEEAITLQKKKLWTNWLNADGLHPLAIGLRIARNLAGGGDRAAAKLAIAQLELRRAELEMNLRQAISQTLIEAETEQQKQMLLQAKMAAHQARLQLAEIGYRLGEGSTDEMWQLWLMHDELTAQLVAVEQQQQQAHQQLIRLIFLA